MINKAQEALIEEIDALVTAGMGRYTWAPGLNDDRVLGLIVSNMLDPEADEDLAALYPALFAYVKARYASFLNAMQAVDTPTTEE